MNIQENKSLKSYNTFGIDVKAKYFVSISHITELRDLLKNKAYPNIFILGGGSNLLLTQDINALVVHINIKGIDICTEENNHVIVKAGAGENWHAFTQWCLTQDFGGVENLSLIPGNIGTAPIQNIGAYGVEIKDVFHSCDAFHKSSGKIKTFTPKECKFDYRNSVFKQEFKGEYIILNVSLKLTANNHKIKSNYGSISNELEALSIDTPTIQDIANAVIKIRSTKLPDPEKIGNSGSFFKNPVISALEFDALNSNFPKIPNYKVSENEIKIPAGWLIEYAGFKGKRFGQYGVHKNQALVLVNYGNAEGKDIKALSELIQETIHRIFNIKLEAEVNII
ncbi:MAG: UDP-N-acetylmuramate dehydrogenase [Flavobacteriaceae bacterium]|nr:UDP-N-acetylmuramate dehydrogenase [Flavobacteriaceae bacterium]